jgi:hypothetical protein
VGGSLQQRTPAQRAGPWRTRSSTAIWTSSSSEIGAPAPIGRERARARQVGAGRFASRVRVCAPSGEHLVPCDSGSSRSPIRVEACEFPTFSGAVSAEHSTKVQRLHEPVPVRSVSSFNT